jgi:NADH:ubiquinone oxidoreductase subunit 5 (subunit L)/multisubunit Na+/H+ antiporter MnhA subunit
MALVKGPLVRLEHFVGEIYEFVIQKPVLGAANLLRKFDSLVIDSAAVGTGRSMQTFSQVLKTLASGHVQHYGLIMAAGILALLALAVFAL